MINNALYLAGCEFKQVTKLDQDGINEHLNKILFYFGSSDGWVPNWMVDDVKERFPKGIQNLNFVHVAIGHITVDKHGSRHAFVMYKNDCDVVVSAIVNFIKL